VATVLDILRRGGVMGRPPSCNPCSSSGGTTNFTGCPFFDSFSKQNLSYQTYSAPVGAVFTESGGTVKQSGTASGNASFYQVLSVPTNTSQLRYITTASTPVAAVSGKSGIFVGQLVGCTVDWTVGVASVFTCDNFGNPTGTYSQTFAVATSKQLQIAVGEFIRQGHWLVQLLIGPSNLVFEVVLDAAITTPVNAGLCCAGATPNVVSWSSGLSISCLDSALGGSCFGLGTPNWTAIASTWKIPAVTGLTSAAGNPCSPCSIYNQPFTLYYNPASPNCGFTDTSGQLIQCQFSGPTDARGEAVWGMALVFNPPNPPLMVLQPAGFPSPPYYQKTAASFNPLGSNTLARTGGTAGCTGWPSTITIAPA
jgi:hypothetical protein